MYARLIVDAACNQIFTQCTHTAKFEIAGKDAAECYRFCRINHQLLLDPVIPQRRVTTHPYPLLFRGGDFVADAFSGDLTLELGEGE